MTRKEFFNAIITANINEELNEFAAAELEKNGSTAGACRRTSQNCRQQ